MVDGGLHVWCVTSVGLALLRHELATEPQRVLVVVDSLLGEVALLRLEA